MNGGAGVRGSTRTAGQAGTGDVYTPTFITVQPDGSIIFDFDGRVHADGLDLDLGTTDPPSDNEQIKWLRASGASGGYIYTADTGVTTRLRIGSRSEAGGGAGGFGTGIQADDTDAGGAGAAVKAFAQDFARTLVDDLGQSDFLQLATFADLKLSFGVKSFLWPGGTAQQVFNVNHNLGKTPQIVLATNHNNNTRGMPRTYTYGATQFVLDIITSDGSIPPITTGDDYVWVAIG